MTLTLAKDRIAISVSSMPGILWDTIGDRTVKREQSKMRPTAGAPQQIDYSRTEYEDVDLEGFWDPSAYPALWNQIESNPSAFDNSTITTQDLDPSGVPIPGSLKAHTGCGIVSAKRDGGDANNGKDKVKLTVSWTIPL